MTTPQRLLALLLTLTTLWFAGGVAAQQSYLDPRVAFQPNAVALDDQTIEVRYRIARGYYLYRDKLAFSLPADSQMTVGTPMFSKGKMKDDELFGRVEVFFEEAVIRLPVERGAIPGPLDLELATVSQGCADGGICYPPQTQTLKVSLPALGSVAPARPPTAVGGDESGLIADLLRDASFWLVLASFFGFGLLLSFTPCVLPMVPILSGIIVGQASKAHPTPRRRAFMLSLVYVLGMAITYTAIGVAAGLSGTLLSASLQNAWVLGSFALVFVVLALSMFGFFELQLPGFLQSKLSDEANHFKGGSYYGVASMGAISALIVGPCVAAPLAGALLYIGQSGDAILGGAALSLMALGMGVPLLLVGLSAGSLVPHAGAWMSAINRAFGVLLLATALWMVSSLLPEWLLMIGWAVLLIVPAIFMHALDPLPPHSHGWLRFWKGVGVLMLLYGAALLIGALAGQRDPLQPLSGFTARSEAGGGATHVRFQRVGSVTELDAVIAAANQPVLLDFYADWCVSCKEMERFTFSDPAVRARMDRFLLLQVDVTINSAEDQTLLKRFKLFGPPGILFFDRSGQEIDGLRVVGFQRAEAFRQILDSALQRAGQRVGQPV